MTTHRRTTYYRGRYRATVAPPWVGKKGHADEELPACFPSSEKAVAIVVPQAGLPLIPGIRETHAGKAKAPASNVDASSPPEDSTAAFTGDPPPSRNEMFARADSRAGTIAHCA